MRHEFSRRRLFQDLALDAVAGVSLWQMPNLARGESLAPDRPLLKPLVDQVICPWSSRHPRHDHQLIFPLDDERLLMVWSEYYASDGKEAPRGQAGVGDAVSCQISSMVSRDRGRSWGERRVLQPNRWKRNVKHPNLVRLSPSELLFTFVGWDSDTARNVYLRRSDDNGANWGEMVQISEPGWYCNNADRAVRLSTGRVLLPAHGPHADTYVGGARYRGGDLHSFVFYSDDGFRTWHRSKNSMTAPGRGCHEPTIVERRDGSLLCLLRNTNQRQYFSVSEDGGERWSTPRPTTLPSPESPALVKRIPKTGDLIVLWNNVASKSNWPRTPLSVALSRDEGESWSLVKDIDRREDYDAAYPSLTFVGDEALIAYYTRSKKWKRDSEVTLRIYHVDQFYV
ncbi:MAG: exo-alpha-sialidase [Planctomycetales bacterium]|nr:exo-alpha-sialidase [Planctomycetales bacterium]